MRLLTLLLLFNLPAYCQEVEIVKHQPNEEYVKGWISVFKYVPVSYVQLPGDSLEYKKIKIYVKYVPGQEITPEEHIRKKELNTLIFLGSYLQKTGKVLRSTVPDGELGIENKSLTITDRLLANE